MTWMHWQLAATLSRAPTTHKPVRGRALPPLLFFTDDLRTPDPASAIQQLPQGCGVVFRHYANKDRTSLAESCRSLAKKQGRLFLIAGDERLAQEIQADGLHLPDYMAPRAPRIRQRQPSWHITLTVHSAKAMHKAQHFDVNALIASPVFPTQSHPDRTSLGVMHIAQWAQASRLPLYALGGVTPHNLIRLKGSGIQGVAAIGGLMR